MPDLKHRQKRIQEKRKNTSWRDFVKEIASRVPISFYKIEGVISRYPKTKRIGEISNTENFFLARDKQGINYDNKESFFLQFQKLFISNKLPGCWHYLPSENSDYADTVGGVKNVYLSFLSSLECENIVYSFVTRNNVNNVLNSVFVIDNCSNIYDCFCISQSYNIFMSRYITNSSHIYYSQNLIGCSECILCSNLENQKYCIENKQYSEEEYRNIKGDILQNLHKKYISGEIFLSETGQNIGSKNIDGSFLVNCTNVDKGLASINIKDGKNVTLCGGTNMCENVYDTIQGVGIKDAYGTVGMALGEHYYCSVHLIGSQMYYSTLCRNCSYCLGCIGLQNKQFCILNKQYTKEERHEKVDEIFSQMEKDGDLGKFFPAWMNPFYFNDTAASLIEDFTKEEIIANGYLRRDEDIKVDIPEWMEVVDVDELGKYEGWKQTPTPKGTPSPYQGTHNAQSSLQNSPPTPLSEGGAKWWIDPTILKKVIRDKDGNVYRVIKMEYDFLMKYGLPLPSKHRLERLKGHFKVK